VRHDVDAVPPSLFLGIGKVGAVLRETVVLGGNRKPFKVTSVEREPAEGIEAEAISVAGVNGTVFPVGLETGRDVAKNAGFRPLRRRAFLKG
jgi:hypothetical protein